MNFEGYRNNAIVPDQESESLPGLLTTLPLAPLFVRGVPKITFY